jgi:hypothetical protein
MLTRTGSSAALQALKKLAGHGPITLPILHGSLRGYKWQFDEATAQSCLPWGSGRPFSFNHATLLQSTPSPLTPSHCRPLTHPHCRLDGIGAGAVGDGTPCLWTRASGAWRPHTRFSCARRSRRSTGAFYGSETSVSASATSRSFADNHDLFSDPSWAMWTGSLNFDELDTLAFVQRSEPRLLNLRKMDEYDFARVGADPAVTLGFFEPPNAAGVTLHSCRLPVLCHCCSSCLSGDISISP